MFNTPLNVSFYQLRPIIHSAFRHGIDLHHALHGLEFINYQPDTEIDGEIFRDIVQVVWDELEDEGMGLLNRELQLGAFDVGCEFCLGKDTLGDALRAVKKYFAVLGGFYKFNYEVIDGNVILSLHYREDISGDKYLISELTFCAWHRFFSWAIGRRINLNSIAFDFPVPSYCRNHRRLFDCRPLYSQPFPFLVFNEQYLLQPILKNANELAEFFGEAPVCWFNSPADDTTFAPRIRTELEMRSGMNEPFPSIESMALLFNVSKHTLCRHLAEERTSYQQIKNEVRKSLAIKLLCESKNTLNYIAERTGFSEASAFSRAFKVWTGSAPDEFRRLYRRSPLV